MTLTTISSRANSDGSSSAAPRRCSQSPMHTARGIWTRQGKIAEGNIRKTAAITSPKIASTMVRPMKSTIMNSRRTRRLSSRPATSPMVWPLLRRLTSRLPKSCTAPMKIEPNTTQTRAGSQPQSTPMAGPTMGPVPAMEVKWWPNTTLRRVGT